MKLNSFDKKFNSYEDMINFNRDHLPKFLRYINNFKDLLSFKKELSFEEEKFLHRCIDKSGFNRGFENFINFRGHDLRKMQKEKNLMINNYANSNFEKEQESDPNYIATYEELKMLKPKRKQELFGVTYLLIQKKGRYYAIIEEPNGEYELLISEKMNSTVQVSREGVAKFNKLVNKYTPDSVQKTIQESYDKPKKEKKEKDSNVDISHVQRAMGIENNAQNNNNNRNNNDDDLDDILGDLF